MTHAEFCTKFGLTPGVMHKPVPGLGILAPYSTGRRGTVTICSSHEQYMHLIFVESECCLVASGNDIWHLVMVKDEIRQGILEYLNHILETLGSPVRYLYNKDHNTLLLTIPRRTRGLSSWCTHIRHQGITRLQSSSVSMRRVGSRTVEADAQTP